MYTGRGALKGDAGCLGINGKKHIRLLDKCEEGDEGAGVTYGKDKRGRAGYLDVRIYVFREVWFRARMKKVWKMKVERERNTGCAGEMSKSGMSRKNKKGIRYLYSRICI